MDDGSLVNDPGRQRAGGEPSFALLGDEGGMVVEDQTDHRWVGQAASTSFRNSMNSRLRWRSLTKA